MGFVYSYIQVFYSICTHQYRHNKYFRGLPFTDVTVIWHYISILSYVMSCDFFLFITTMYVVVPLKVFVIGLPLFSMSVLTDTILRQLYLKIFFDGILKEMFRDLVSLFYSLVIRRVPISPLLIKISPSHSLKDLTTWQYITIPKFYGSTFSFESPMCEFLKRKAIHM